MIIDLNKNTALCLFLLIYLSILVPNAYSQTQNTSYSQSSGGYNNNRGNVSIDWQLLNLTEDQKRKIKELDLQWTSLEQTIRPKILRDQQQLKTIMVNPNADDNQIRKLQKDIMIRQEQLRYEATENFLSKRRLLNDEQRQKLHKMMPR